MASQTTPQSVSRRTAVTPLVVRQILDCRQQEFRLFGTPVNIACLVGIIRNLNLQSSQIHFYIEDHSGKIKGVMCLETEDEAASKFPSIKANKYAQVFGTIRFENMEKKIMVIKIREVDDANMKTCHLLQFILKRLEAEAELKQQVSSATSTGAALVMALAVTDEVTATNVPLRMTPFQESIYNIVKAEDSDFGITKTNILRQFPSYQGLEVNRAIEYLISEGLIYPTTDQNHLKATMNY